MDEEGRIRFGQIDVLHKSKYTSEDDEV